MDIVEIVKHRAEGRCRAECESIDSLPVIVRACWEGGGV